jgi:tetratricopeptide (TPR) repeat protein
LARLLAGPEGQLLVSAFGYFLRQAVADQPGLRDKLHFEMLSQVWRAQAQGWEVLGRLLAEQGDALAAELAKINALIQERLPEDARRGGVPPRLSALLQSADDVRLLAELERRVNAVLAGERSPALLDGLGRLAMGVGVYDRAGTWFQQAAALAGPASAQAEAYYNSYRAFLEQRLWHEALAALLNAARLDAGRFAPFPLDKIRAPADPRGGGLWGGFSVPPHPPRPSCGGQDSLWGDAGSGHRRGFP